MAYLLYEKNREVSPVCFQRFCQPTISQVTAGTTKCTKVAELISTTRFAYAESYPKQQASELFATYFVGRLAFVGFLRNDFLPRM